MKIKSVKNSFSLWAGLCVLVTAIIVVSYSAVTMRSEVIETAIEENTLLAKTKAASIESRLDSVYESAAILSQSLSGIKNTDSSVPIDRSMVLGILRNVLEDNGILSGIFTCWEPNAFNDQTGDSSQDEGNAGAGRFAVYLSKKAKDSIDQEPLLLNTTLAPDGKPGEWYDIPKKSLKGHILEPVEKNVLGRRELVTVFVLPIIKGNQFYGVIGLEAQLEFLQQLADAKQDVRHSAQIAIISNNGTLVGVSGKPELAGQGLQKLHSDYENDLEYITNGKDIMEVMDDALEFYFPVFIGDTRNPWSVNVVVDMDDYTTVVRSIILKMSLMGALCIAASWFLLRYMAGDIVGPLARVVDLAGAMARRDLTQRLAIKRDDEIGLLSNALDGSCESLSVTIAEVKENARMQATASQEMSSVSSQMAASAEEMSSQSDSVAGATEQMSASVNSMASAAEEMSVNIQSVSSTAEEMSSNMNSIASSIEQMSTSVEEVARSAKEGLRIAEQATAMSTDTTTTMNALGKAAEEIGEVTNLIKRIAEQTNLLALNATIEAASAGDAGKGFAVVANEIKELAHQSGQAASAIAKRIMGMQENTDSAINSITGISEIIQRVNEASSNISRSVEEQTSTSVEISDSVQQASSGISNIANSIAELARGANDVSKSAAEAARAISEVSANIQGMNTATKESSTGALEVNKTAEELARIAAQLQDEMDKFKV